jgi:hypothetical protein
MPTTRVPPLVSKSSVPTVTLMLTEPSAPATASSGGAFVVAGGSATSVAEEESATDVLEPFDADELQADTERSAAHANAVPRVSVVRKVISLFYRHSRSVAPYFGTSRTRSLGMTRPLCRRQVHIPRVNTSVYAGA